MIIAPTLGKTVRSLVCTVRLLTIRAVADKKDIKDLVMELFKSISNVPNQNQRVNHLPPFIGDKSQLVLFLDNLLSFFCISF